MTHFCNTVPFPAGRTLRQRQLYELFLILSADAKPGLCAGGVKPNQLFER
jgi:hypothetical protein